MKRLILFITLCFISLSTWAHPEGAIREGLLQGLLHPILGWDHLLMMLALGAWTVVQGGKATSLWPLILVSSMVLAALCGFASYSSTLIEPTILATTLIIGLFLASWQRLPSTWANISVMLSTFVHGYAHGLEIPANGSSLTYLLGLICSSLLLYGIGICLAHRLHRQTIRLGGSALMLFSAYSAIC